ncbi:MAG: TauD/TfdA family dioxygenase [Hyphomicrobiaceae bacterium]|nr:TauD/TfdA family dioxygenase [Hyphomicrobiaceae bacterium]
MSDTPAYAAWRAEKLANYPRSVAEIRVAVGDLSHPSPDEQARIRRNCQRAGVALYRSYRDVPAGSHAVGSERRAVQQFASAFALGGIEAHRSADTDGIVAIEVSAEPGRRNFVPYSTRALNWHTDGYYNQPHEPIRTMLLHCVRPAASGGENALLDPEIVYLRLRDTNPALVAALMHPAAMTIPESVEEDATVRPISTGPVFLFDDTATRLTMRYTARTRSIHWRDDADTKAAVALLHHLLVEEQEPLILRHRLEAGEGLLTNNVLHTRSAFAEDPHAGRLMLRARYHEAIAWP